MSSWGLWGLHTAAEDDDYRDSHQAPDAESGAPMHDVTQGIYPPGFYEEPFHYYGSDEGTGERDSWYTVRKVRGNPDAKVKIHRALPLEHATRKRGLGLTAPLNTGDWVTPSYDYAHEHGMSRLEGNTPWTVVTSTVPASQLHTNGDSLAEWGYNGPAANGYEGATAAGRRKYRDRKQKTESETTKNFHHCGFCGSPSGESCERGCWGRKKYSGERDVRGELPETPGVSGGGEIDYDPAALRDIRLSHRSTDGIRYAHTVEADVADDLMRLAGLNGDLPEGLTFQHHPPGFKPFPDVIMPTVDVSSAWPTVSAHDGDKMIGHLQWDDSHPRKKGQIWDLRVHPDYQRRGVATALFDWTTDNVEPDLQHSNNLSDEGRAFAESEVKRPLAEERYEAWRNGQPMPKRFAMAWDQWAPQIKGGCDNGCDHDRMMMGEYSIDHPSGSGDHIPGIKGRSLLQFTHDTDQHGNPEMYVSGIHVDENHRRDGIAEALMRRMHQDHPDTPINPGFTTDDGQGLLDGLKKRIPEAGDALVPRFSRLAMPAPLPECPRHAGEWGDNDQCPSCTDTNGDPRPVPEGMYDPPTVTHHPSGLTIEQQGPFWHAQHPDGEWVGFLHAPQDHPDLPRYIGRIQTDPRYRGQGIATALWEAAGKPLHTPQSETNEGGQWARSVGAGMWDYDTHGWPKHQASRTAMPNADEHPYKKFIPDIRRIRQEIADAGETNSEGGPSCGVTSEELAQFLRGHGVDASENYGAYRLPNGGRPEHAWVDLPGGSILDATADQFGGEPIRFIHPDHPDHKNYLNEYGDDNSDYKNSPHRTAMPTWYHLTDDPDFKLDPDKEPANYNGNHPFGKGVFLTQRPDEWAYTEDDGGWSGDRPYIAEIDAPENLHEKLNVWHDPHSVRPDDPYPGSDETFVPNYHFPKLKVRNVKPRWASRTAAFDPDALHEQARTELGHLNNFLRDGIHSGVDMTTDSIEYHPHAHRIEMTPHWAGEAIGLDSAANFSRRTRARAGQYESVLSRMVSKGPMDTQGGYLPPAHEHLRSARNNLRVELQHGNHFVVPDLSAFSRLWNLTDADALGAVNPRYHHGTGGRTPEARDAYKVNCQRCVLALDARHKGYNVEARPNFRDVGNPHADEQLKDNHIADWWKDQNGMPGAWIDVEDLPDPSKRPDDGSDIADPKRRERYLRENADALHPKLVDNPGPHHWDHMTDVMASWGEGARGLIATTRHRPGGYMRHVIHARVGPGGKIAYDDPQDPTAFADHGAHWREHTAYDLSIYSKAERDEGASLYDSPIARIRHRNMKHSPLRFMRVDDKKLTSSAAKYLVDRGTAGPEPITPPRNI